MTRRRRRAPILLLLSALLVLAACSDDSGSDDDGGSDGTTTTEVPARRPGRHRSAAAAARRRRPADRVRARLRRLGPAVRVAGDALRRQRLPAGAHRRLRPRRRRRSTSRATPTGSTRSSTTRSAELRRRAGVPRRPLPRARSSSSTYLGDPAQAAKVAKYVAIDGQPVPRRRCRAWRPTQETVPGPVPRRGGHLAGVVRRAVRVPRRRGARGRRHRPAARAGRALGPGGELPGQHRPRGRTLDIWEIDADTGARTGDEPHATFELGRRRRLRARSRSSPAPTTSTCSRADDSPVQHHLYLQPYVRSSHLVRLLSSPPDGATRANTNVGDDHSALIAIRMREWYADDDPTDRRPARRARDQRRRRRAGRRHHRLRRQRRHRPAHPRRRRHARARRRSEPLPYFSDPALPERRRRLHAGVGRRRAARSPSRTSRAATPTDPRRSTSPTGRRATHAISVVFTDWPVDSSD